MEDHGRILLDFVNLVLTQGFVAMHKGLGKAEHALFWGLMDLPQQR